MGMTQYYPDNRITLSVRVCPDTYEGLRDAANDMGVTMQDCILGAILMEYGLYTYSPDALACPITAGDISVGSEVRLRRLARLAGPLYRPPHWYSEQLQHGTLISGLQAQLTLAKAASAEYGRYYTTTP